MSDITFQSKAYCKILLHATKYPHCAVNGILLAKSSSAKTKELIFEDAVPLFHIQLNLSPMAEVALAQVDELVSQKGLCIAGYYVAHENLLDSSLEGAEGRISERIATNLAHPCLVVVDNKNLSLPIKNIGLKVAQYSDGSYRPCDVHRIHLHPEKDKTLDIATELLERKVYDQLVDFDSHLDNVSLDWMNPDVNKEIEAIV